jgi:hypothetical protein
MRLRFAVSFEPTAGPKGRPTRRVFSDLLCELCVEISVTSATSVLRSPR